MNKVDLIKKHIANTLTILNMVCGGASIIATLAGRYKIAVSLIILAGIFDRYDGAMARRFNTTSELGIQLDSMADALSFGIAPAILVYVSKFYDLEKINIILSLVTVIYIVCGLFRLARYNASGLDDDGNFIGIPITACGMFLVALILFKRSIPYYIYAVIMLFLAFMMVSTFKIKKR